MSEKTCSKSIGADLTGILGGGCMAELSAVEAKNTFSFIVMQVIWCLKFCNMTKSLGGGTIPTLQILGGTCPPGPLRDLRP